MKHLGELVLRTPRLSAMRDFYGTTIGLQVYRKVDSATFYRIADDWPGHPQILAVFADDWESNGPEEPEFTGHDAAQSPVHHFAFSMELSTWRRELERLRDLGQTVRTTAYPDLGWRSFYVYDPDGNTVEFVCHDPSASAPS